MVQAMSKCPHCGGIAGKAHVCRAANQKMRAEESPEAIRGRKRVLAAQDVEREDDVKDAYEEVVTGKRPSRSSKKALTVHLDPAFLKEVRIRAVEQEVSLETFVEDALRRVM